MPLRSVQHANLKNSMAICSTLSIPKLDGSCCEISVPFIHHAHLASWRSPTVHHRETFPTVKDYAIQSQLCEAGEVTGLALTEHSIMLT
eukprot:1155211-Pelagomonas_calceolata.AAC.7